jgi:hypothetical protein
LIGECRDRNTAIRGHALYNVDPARIIRSNPRLFFMPGARSACAA